MCRQLWVVFACGAALGCLVLEPSIPPADDSVRIATALKNSSCVQLGIAPNQVFRTSTCISVPSDTVLRGGAKNVVLCSTARGQTSCLLQVSGKVSGLFLDGDDQIHGKGGPWMIFGIVYLSGEAARVDRSIVQCSAHPPATVWTASGYARQLNSSASLANRILSESGAHPWPRPPAAPRSFFSVGLGSLGAGVYFYGTKGQAILSNSVVRNCNYGAIVHVHNEAVLVQNNLFEAILCDAVSNSGSGPLRLDVDGNVFCGVGYACANVPGTAATNYSQSLIDPETLRTCDAGAGTLPDRAEGSVLTTLSRQEKLKKARDPFDTGSRLSVGLRKCRTNDDGRFIGGSFYFLNISRATVTNNRFDADACQPSSERNGRPTGPALPHSFSTCGQNLDLPQNSHIRIMNNSLRKTSVTTCPIGGIDPRFCIDTHGFDGDCRGGTPLGIWGTTDSDIENNTLENNVGENEDIVMDGGTARNLFQQNVIIGNFSDVVTCRDRACGIDDVFCNTSWQKANIPGSFCKASSLGMGVCAICGGVSTSIEELCSRCRDLGTSLLQIV